MTKEKSKMCCDVSDRVGVAATRRHAWVRPRLFAVTLVMAFALVPTAMAEGDAGEHTFFQDQVRQMREAPAQPAYRTHAAAPPTIGRATPRQAAYGLPPRDLAPREMFRHPPSRVASRPAVSAPRLALVAPLTIHPSAKPASTVPAQLVSIFEDRTLRRGDVVIMSEGPRIFAGSQRFPYADKDFVAVHSVSGVTKEFRRDLDAIANNPYQHI